MRPLEPQALKTIPFWGATFKFSMDVFLNTYEYFTADGDNNAWGQIVRFKSANATDEFESGSRLPSVWAQRVAGGNRLHISYVIQNDSNIEIDFIGNDKTPEIKKWFTITISQRPNKVIK